CLFLPTLIPLSALFTYSTLFRSGCRRPHAAPQPVRCRGVLARAHSLRSVSRSRPRVLHGAGLRGRADLPSAERGGPSRPLRLRRDRKSTRLNSSHVKISYAVFCL